MRARFVSADHSQGRRFVAAVIAVYVLARLVSAILLQVLTRFQVPVSWTGPEVDYTTIVGLWDAGWYKEIATNGYPEVMPRNPQTGVLQQNPWAFYPLFPFLTRGLMTILGTPFAITGAMLSFLLGGAAAVVIAGTLRDRLGAQVALAATAVWATCAPSPVLQVAYTESLAILLLALVLRSLDRGRWWAAAGFALLTGIARPIAVPLGLVALVAVVVRWRGRQERAIDRSEYTGMVGALVACGLAGLTWPTVVWMGTGVRTAYTDTMATWRQGQDIVPLKPWVGISKYLFGDGGGLMLLVLVILIVGVAVGPWASRLGPVLRAWILAYPFYLALVLDPGTSLFRYLLPCFPWAVIAVDGAWRLRAKRSARGAAGESAAEAAPDRARPEQALPEQALPDQARPELQEEEASPPPARLFEPSPGRLWALTAGWVVFGVITQWWWLYELWRIVPPADFPP